jgi:hypothetical protein
MDRPREQGGDRDRHAVGEKLGSQHGEHAEHLGGVDLARPVALTLEGAMNGAG